MPRCAFKRILRCRRKADFVVIGKYDGVEFESMDFCEKHANRFARSINRSGSYADIRVAKVRGK